MPSRYSKKLFTVALFILTSTIMVSAQNNIGMATGNYAGISGVWMNPASIVDSRYKFDINIIGLNSYFTNNYLLVKNGAMVRRLFSKDPYNNSFAAVKKDILEEGPLSGKIYARTENNVQFPLSFLVTTSKRSAFAITMVNRTINKIDNLNPLTAQLFYNELRKPSLYNQSMNNDSLKYNFLNWQEVGFTYGRVLIGKGNIFLKAAVTAKWLGAGAAGFMQADKLTLSFKDSNTVSINSPLIKYGRTTSADLGQFQRKNLFNNIENQALGFDAGLVFELRSKINKFKYLDADKNTALRADKNKYIFRLGISVVDLGEFNFSKKPLTNDHSASIVNWNFANVKANNLSDFDTAYSKLISNIPGSSSTFSYRLPAAVIVNFDLHLAGGFYINVAAKEPLSGYGAKATTYIESDRWTVITPRFESRLIGIYVPVSRTNNRTNIGATIKVGPFYAGSNNLSELLSNQKTSEADFHAGVRISILQGKPSKFLLNVKRLIDDEPTNIRSKQTMQTQVDSLSREVLLLKSKSPEGINKPIINIIIQNNDGKVQSKLSRLGDDSIIVNNQVKNTANNPSPTRNDSTSGILLKQLINNQTELQKMQQVSNQQNSKLNKNRKSNNNNDLENELEAIRRQMAIQNTALIAATTANIATNNKKGIVTVVTDSLTKKDSTLQLNEDSINQKKDSAVANTIPSAIQQKNVNDINKEPLIFRDTILQKADTIVLGHPTYQSIYFETNKSNIANEGEAILKKVVADLLKYKEWRIELTGRTDASGTMTINQKVASARIKEVQDYLINSGVNENRILSAIAVGNSKVKSTISQRRVDILILHK